MVFETTDYEDNPVVLSEGTWLAKAGDGEPGSHPEIKGYESDVRAALETPDLVFQSTRDPRSRIFYRLGVDHGDFAGKHLAVVVKHVSEPVGLRGYVSTMYLTRSVYSKGTLLWTRSQPTLPP